MLFVHERAYVQLPRILGYIQLYTGVNTRERQYFSKAGILDGGGDQKMGQAGETDVREQIRPGARRALTGQRCQRKYLALLVVGQCELTVSNGYACTRTRCIFSWFQGTCMVR